MIPTHLNTLSEKVRTLQALQAQTATDLAALEKSILHEAFSGEFSGTNGQAPLPRSDQRHYGP